MRCCCCRLRWGLHPGNPSLLYWLAKKEKKFCELCPVARLSRVPLQWAYWGSASPGRGSQLCLWLCLGPPSRSTSTSASWPTRARNAGQFPPIFGGAPLPYLCDGLMPHSRKWAMAARAEPGRASRSRAARARPGVNTNHYLDPTDRWARAHGLPTATRPTCTATSKKTGS